VDTQNYHRLRARALSCEPSSFSLPPPPPPPPSHTPLHPSRPPSLFNVAPVVPPVFSLIPLSFTCTASSSNLLNTSSSFSPYDSICNARSTTPLLPFLTRALHPFNTLSTSTTLTKAGGKRGSFGPPFPHFIARWSVAISSSESSAIRGATHACTRRRRLCHKFSTPPSTAEESSSFSLNKLSIAAALPRPHLYLVLLLHLPLRGHRFPHRLLDRLPLLMPVRPLLLLLLLRFLQSLLVTITSTRQFSPSPFSPSSSPCFFLFLL